jgi:hypothetical protein
MKMTCNSKIVLLLGVTTMLIAGCGEKLPDGMPKPVPCEIIVTQDGTPLEGALVSLQPSGDGKWSSVGKTNATGKAAVFTLDRYKGAVPGKYKVVVSKTETESRGPVSSDDVAAGRSTSLASFDLVEEKYGNPITTPLEIEVVKGTVGYPVDAGKAVRNKLPER